MLVAPAISTKAATLDIPMFASLSPPSTPDPYNVFVPVGVALAGTAQSVIFGGAANFIAFDSITIGSQTPQGAVPEPSTWAMMILGFVGLGFMAYRRKAKPA